MGSFVEAKADVFNRFAKSFISDSNCFRFAKPQIRKLRHNFSFAASAYISKMYLMAYEPPYRNECACRRIKMTASAIVIKYISGPKQLTPKLRMRERIILHRFESSVCALTFYSKACVAIIGKFLSVRFGIFVGIVGHFGKDAP